MKQALAHHLDSNTGIESTLHHDSIDHQVDHSSLLVQHFGHIIIFGVGFAVSIFLLLRNYYQNRKLSHGQSLNQNIKK